MNNLTVIVDGKRIVHEDVDVFPKNVISADVIKLLYPAAKIIVHDLKRDQWIVTTGEGDR